MELSIEIQSLFDFFKQAESPFLNLYIPKDGNERLSYYVPSSTFNYFQIVGRNEAGSLICLWKPEHSLPLEKTPLVWIDSEGLATGVFARNSKEFLSMLPYGTGAFPHIMYTFKRWASKPDYFKDPFEEINSQLLNQWIEESKNRYSAYNQFMDWLNNTMNIPICPDLVSTVQEAMNYKPSLSDWLKQFS